MPIYYAPDEKLIAWYGGKPIKKFRPIISKLLIDKFSKRLYSEAEITEILFFTLQWYQDEFLKILKEEHELTFYQGLFLLHEFSCVFHHQRPNTSPVEEISAKEFAMYRRILKLCLEQACDLKLVSKEAASLEYLKSKENIIDDLLYLGDFIYTCSNLLAEQQLVEDSVDLKFTTENQFYFDHKHHYGYLINELTKSYKGHIDRAVTGGDDFNDFIKASKNCLGVEYGQALGTIQEIHNYFDAGKFTLDEWFIYPKNLENLYGVPFAKAEAFFKGLTLSRDNKMSLQDAVYKPHNINKYLYRPFLIWNVDGKDMTFVGDRSFIESIMSLCTNAFGWNKYPTEWGNKCFKQYIKQKVMHNDKILENEAESIFKNNSIVYERNLTHLKKWNGQNTDIKNEECGEIDFLFVHNDKIYVADSKHQLARYDMNNFRNDYSYFELKNKSYNKTIERKLNFLTTKIEEVEEHFQVIQNDKKLKIQSFQLEAIFIINTPTFIMHNNQFRLHTLKSLEEIVQNRFNDQKYNLFIDEEHHQKFLSVSYPYFKKPTYKTIDFDVFDDE
jgi:hypothetical protein